MMTVEELNNFCKDTLISHLDITFTQVGDKTLSASMPVIAKTMQPMGILHGGASLAMAETVGSAASFLLVDAQKYSVLGLQVTGNHVAGVSAGSVHATASLIHQGNSTHVWDVRIEDDEKRLISICRVTNFIKEMKDEA